MKSLQSLYWSRNSLPFMESEGYHIHKNWTLTGADISVDVATRLRAG